MYICEAHGREDFIKEFKTLSAAQKELAKLAETFSDEYADMYELSHNEFRYGETEHYQCIFIYKKPKTKRDKILLEIERARYGLEQYSFELMDSYTCGYHLDNLELLICNEIEEV